MISQSNEELLSLPIMCLSTATELTVRDLVANKNIIIDLWTTRCTRCPDALDKLNYEASQIDLLNESTEFVSICLGGTVDAAREILEEPSVPRWIHMSHYFMDNDSKEKAKQILQFKTVPYYIVCNDNNEIVEAGNKCMDLKTLPGRTQPEPVMTQEWDTEVNQSAAKLVGRSSSPSRVFEIEALDF